MRQRTLYYAPDCYCYRTWGLCPPCVAWNAAPTPVWYVGDRPEVPSDRCRHGKLSCNACDTGVPSPHAATWGATV